MQLIDITPAVVDALSAEDRLLKTQDLTLTAFGADKTTYPQNDTVGPGDELNVQLYEIGIALFGGLGIDETGATASERRPQQFSAVSINRNGSIKLPYTGQLHVSGHTTDEIEGMIEKAYKGKSQAPQAIVTLAKNVRNTVYVTGDVRKPGRVGLSLRAERLLDVIADAGGTVSQTQDMVVRVSRGSQTIDERLDRVRAGGPDDIQLHAGDVVELIREPETYSVFGAVPKVMQISFDQTDLTLAEAVARAGGPNDALANPKAIFLFRYRQSSGHTPAPVIYRLNLMQPEGYFLSQHMRMRNKDVLYVSNAKINQLSKFIGILNQLASPFITARAIQQ